jgi:hypothetical protein
MPPARGQPAEHGGLSGRLIEMKRLRIELRGERFDSLFIHPIGVGREPLADVQIFQIEARFMFHGYSSDLVAVHLRCIYRRRRQLPALELRSRDSALASRK